jgi:hypothetical protein
MDQVVLNELERAASADVNNLQHLGSRLLTDSLRWLGSQRRYPAVTPASGADTAQSPQTWCLGLTVEVVGTNYMVNPGMLSSVFPDNLTLDSLEGQQPIGFLRAAVVRPLPSCNPARTQGEYYLISARIVRTTTSQVVEVFDVPTQTFVPQNRPKRAEFTVEFREDAGPQVPGQPTYGAWPALNAYPSNAGWTPIAIVRVFTSSANADYGQVYDVRRDLRDELRAAPWDPFPYSADTPLAPPEVRIRACEATASPSDNSWGRFLWGHFRASLRGGDYSAAVPQGFVIPQTYVFANELETLTPGALTHFYLVPLRIGSTYRVPSYGMKGTNGLTGSIAMRGVIVACQSGAAPTRQGVNGGAIRLPRTTGLALFPDYDDVQIGEAVWVYSAQSTSGSATDAVPWTMAGNRFMYALNASASDQRSAPRVVNVALASGSTVWACDLTAYVPQNARWVELAVRLAPGNTASGPARCEVKIAKEDAKIGTPGTSALDTKLVLDSISIGTGHPNTEWWGKLRVPLFSLSDDDPIAKVPGYFGLAIEFEYEALSGSTFGSCQAAVYVAGWEV